MLRAEFFKIRRHRLPRLLLAVMIIGHVAPSLALIVYTPETPSAYDTTWTHVFQILPSILSIVFGGWLLGTEYRQDTLKRLLASEPRRQRILAVKGLAGATVLAVAITSVAVLGWAAARVVGELNGYNVAWNGRELLSGGLFALGAATLTFLVSAIARHDAIAMVATLAIVLILDPLLGLVPRVGKFTFAGSLETLTARIGGNAGGMFDTSLLTTLEASLTVACWLTAAAAVATYLFTVRDI